MVPLGGGQKRSQYLIGLHRGGGDQLITSPHPDLLPLREGEEIKSPLPLGEDLGEEKERWLAKWV